MINISLICKSNQWPARLKKVSKIVNAILYYQDELNFSEDIIYDCNIILTDNKLIKKMNYKYRKKNKVTDVLTFISEINLVKNNKQKICDIFVSSEMIKKDAKKNTISFYDHFTHLLIHSFLHINGYKHNKIREFNKMKNKEISVLKKLQINNPYLIS